MASEFNGYYSNPHAMLCFCARTTDDVRRYRQQIAYLHRVMAASLFSIRMPAKLCELYSHGFCRTSFRTSGFGFLILSLYVRKHTLCLTNSESEKYSSWYKTWECPNYSSPCYWRTFARTYVSSSRVLSTLADSIYKTVRCSVVVVLWWLIA